MSDVHIWIDKENKIARLTVDGERLDPKIRFKVDWNYWSRDKITIHTWNDGWNKGDAVTFEALFQIVFSTN